MCDSLFFSRIRRIDDGSLSTTGHDVSLSAERLRGQLQKKDASRVLVLDDTSFSGATSLLAEEVLESAGIAQHGITHGFMIANAGELAPGVPGALQKLGSAVVGHAMKTPRDDGWHIFDIVQQEDLATHLGDLQHALHHPECEARLFSRAISGDELRKKQRAGTFIANNGSDMQGLHSKNPQLLPRIVQAGHMNPPNKWHGGEDAVFSLLLEIGQIIRNGEHT